VPHVGMEYAILIPILILQVILLPLSTGLIMSVWTNNRIKSEIQDAANQVSSTIQQLYFSLNREDVLSTSNPVVQASNFPTTIESSPYYGTGSMKASPSNSSRTLNLRFTLQGPGIAANSSVTFGPNVSWRSSTFFSNSSSACIKALKYSNRTIMFSFG
jgi:hypothetical protein